MSTDLQQLPWKLFGSIVVLWLVVGIVPYVLWRDLHNAGDFANTFGFANALFAALAFGGVIWAIRLQTKELELQREEIEETRDELRRSADAQHRSQEMHFLAALLSARNSVAQGYAAAAQRETGALRPSQIAHRRQLMELEWLLRLVDQHSSNPFALAPPSTMVAQQAALVLTHSHPLLQAALKNRAANHARTLLLDLNQALRELHRLLPAEEANESSVVTALDAAIHSAEAVSHACDCDEIAAICCQSFNRLGASLESVLGSKLPLLVQPDIIAGTSGAIATEARALP